MRSRRGLDVVAEGEHAAPGRPEDEGCGLPHQFANWLAMTLAIVLPVEVKDVGRILVLPISIVTAIVSPNALPKARI